MELEKVFIDIELEGRKKSIDYVYVFCTPYKKGIKKIVVNGLLIFQCVKNKTYFIKTIDNSHEYYKGIFSNYERKKVFLKKNKTIDERARNGFKFLKEWDITRLEEIKRNLAERKKNEVSKIGNSSTSNEKSTNNKKKIALAMGFLGVFLIIKKLKNG